MRQGKIFGENSAPQVKMQERFAGGFQNRRAFSRAYLSAFTRTSTIILKRKMAL